MRGEQGGGDPWRHSGLGTASPFHFSDSCGPKAHMSLSSLRWGGGCKAGPLVQKALASDVGKVSHMATLPQTSTGPAKCGPLAISGSSVHMRSSGFTSNPMLKKEKHFYSSVVVGMSGEVECHGA